VTPGSNKNQGKYMSNQDPENAGSRTPPRLLSWPMNSGARQLSSSPAEPSQIEVPTPAAPKPPSSIGDSSFGGVLGHVEVLSDQEEIRLKRLELVVATGWRKFVDVGLALVQIRDDRLYRIEFPTFESYCRSRWQYGRHYVNRVIAAAHAFSTLEKTCLQKPEHESQMHPLLGLPDDQAKLAWECAVQFARGGKVTARIVKQAVQELQPTRKLAGTPSGPNKSELRVLVSNSMAELFTLLTQKAAYDLLTQRFEVLHRQFRSLFPERRKKKAVAG
jgi:hypothetical protein